SACQATGHRARDQRDCHPDAVVFRGHRVGGPLSASQKEMTMRDDSKPTPRLRARALGLPLSGEPGPDNAITDVPGVLVGHETLSSRADPSLQTGDLPVETG